MANQIQTKTANKSVLKIVPEAIRQQAKKDYEASTMWDKKTKSHKEFTKEFFTLTEVKKLKELLDVIYPTSKFSPALLTQTNDDLIETGTIVKYHPRDLKDAKRQFLLAFVNRVNKNLFKIFINEDCEDESFDSMDLHEKGHILFNHTQAVKFYMDEFRDELEKVWDTRLTKFFAKEIEQNPKNKEKIVKLLFKEFANIAQDMEINSKLFHDDWIKAKKTIARSGMIVYMKDLKNEFDDLSGLFKNSNVKDVSSKSYLMILQKFEVIRKNIVSRIEGEEGDFQFCYPANKGWPLELDWMTYMILLVKDLDDTMQQVIKNIKAALGMAEDGSGQPISQDVLDAYSEQSENGDSAAKGAGKNDEDADDFGEDDLEDEITRKGRSHGGQGRGRGSSAGQVYFECVSNFEDFTKFLRKTCIGKKNRKWNSDVLYNSNRGKFASRVVVPRRHLIEKWMPVEITVVIDISGSVNTDLVERAVNSILDTNAGIDIAHSHIIFCDTRVVHDEIMSKRTKKVYSGGGTDMAEGIKYVVQKGYCKKRTDLFFLISDMQDQLSSWIHEGKNLHCRKFAIGYGYSNKNDSGQVFHHHGQTSFAKEWNNCWEKTVFIMCD